MIARLAAVALVVGAVPGALWLAGALLPPPAEPAGPPKERFYPRQAEADWIARTNEICRWAEKQSRAVHKAYRSLATPADAQFYLDSAVRLNDRAAAMFRRLRPPLAFTKEWRRLVALHRRESRALTAMSRALHRGNARAFGRNLRLLVAAHEEEIRIFGDLGATKCRPAPAPSREREAPTV